MAILNRNILARGLLALALCAFAAGAQTPPLEYQVKASYLYNFARFITWPEDAFVGDGKFNLCAVGADRFGTALDALTGERVEGRAILVRRLERAAQARGARCHLLFIGAGTDGDPAAVASERAVLTIGESA